MFAAGPELKHPTEPKGEWGHTQEETFHCCIHHLVGKIPKLEVIRKLETSLDLPVTVGPFSGHPTHEKES